MRIVFMGTPGFAVASLDAIIHAGITVAAVVTVPDKPAGRGRKIQESAVKQYAVEHHIPVLQPEKLKNPEFLEQLESFQADLFVVVAFRMLPEVVWRMPRLGTINLHASLLPDYRGAAPINWVVINGESVTGTTVFFIEKEIDTGNIISQHQENIYPEDNAGTLHDRLMVSGASHLAKAIQMIGSGNYHAMPQVLPAGEAKVAPKIFKDTCKISWEQPAIQIHNLVRGLSPYPVAWTGIITPNGQQLMLKIYETEVQADDHLPSPGTISSDGKSFLHIAAADGWIIVKDLQMEGKKRMGIRDFLMGIADMNACRIA